MRQLKGGLGLVNLPPTLSPGKGKLGHSEPEDVADIQIATRHNVNSPIVGVVCIKVCVKLALVLLSTPHRGVTLR